MFLLDMDLLPRILMLLFLITAMLSVGLQTTAGDLRSLLRSKGSAEYAAYGLYDNPFQENRAGIKKVMMFNRNGHLDHEREAVRERGEIQGNIKASWSKSVSSRRLGLFFKKPPSPPVR